MSDLSRSKRYVSYDDLVIYTRNYRRYQQKLTLGCMADALQSMALSMLIVVRSLS